MNNTWWSSQCFMMDLYITSSQKLQSLSLYVVQSPHFFFPLPKCLFSRVWLIGAKQIDPQMFAKHLRKLQNQCETPQLSEQRIEKQVTICFKCNFFTRFLMGFNEWHCSMEHCFFNNNVRQWIFSSMILFLESLFRLVP